MGMGRVAIATEVALAKSRVSAAEFAFTQIGCSHFDGADFCRPSYSRSREVSGRKGRSAWYEAKAGERGEYALIFAIEALREQAELVAAARLGFDFGALGQVGERQGADIRAG